MIARKLDRETPPIEPSFRYFSFEDRSVGVRKVREACGWSQQELADAANVCQAKISRFETCTQDLSEAAFLRVEKALLKARIAHWAELKQADEVLQRVGA